VLDGELVIVIQGRLDFEALQLRLHPAASRVNMLSETSPASFVAWDLLALGEEDLRALPQSERRRRLERALEHVRAPVHLTPITRDRAVAEDWFGRFEGAGLDGVIAKPEQLPYTPDKRVMLKIKHQRTADCVVCGFRWFKGGKDTLVGSLILGLYDEEKNLRPVGVCASFKRAERAALAEKLKPLRENALQTHPWREWAGQMPSGMGSRWNPDKELGWEPIELGLVVEVSFDHMQGKRFRHATHFVRWRSDKQPQDCTYEQLEVTPPIEIARIFPGG
jgi:ATP-dependent DNA ligase